MSYSENAKEMHLSNEEIRSLYLVPVSTVKSFNCMQLSSKIYYAGSSFANNMQLKT